ncbi:MAG: rhodanese-like domain-containing protein [Nitrospirae bacterium]|jgi:rhodanese-related sulfurtransferase|nr:rhodanese-like domain-containing protein [Nitrospirota bacterium]
MKKIGFITFLLASFFMTAVNAYAGAYPDDMMKTIMAMKADAEVKKDMPASFPGIEVVNSDTIQKMLKTKKAVILDNRVKSQFDTEKIAGAEWLFCDDLLKDPALAGKLDKSKEYILYCNGTHCWRSPSTALMLQHLGFTKLFWYRDGMPDWKKKGLPTE